jgi:menaquinone-dependent protoporphyrinogen IX oxidase
MRTAVYYKTMTGCTQKYAETVSKKLGADLSSLDRVHSGSLKDYDTVVFGGCVHMGKISGLKKFKKFVRKNERVRPVVFAVGASAVNKKTIGDLVKNNFPEGLGKIKFFYLKGGMDLQKMKQPYRTLMKWVKGMVEMNPDKKPDEIEFLKMFDQEDDPVNDKSTAALIRYAGDAAN